MPLPGNESFKPQRSPLNLDDEVFSSEPEGAEEEVQDEPIQLASEDTEQDVSKIRTFETNSVLNVSGRKLERPVTKGGNATRMKLFHAKLSDTAMRHMEGQINEWLDENPEFEVKFVETTVGPVEGKRTEEHMLVTVWY